MRIYKKIFFAFIPFFPPLPVKRYFFLKFFSLIFNYLQKSLKLFYIFIWNLKTFICIFVLSM